MGDSTTVIRPAVRADVPVILELIHGLAEYENEPDAVVASEDLLAQHLFGTQPGAEVAIADLDGRPAGFALFFHNFSTFRGRRGLYLEDLFVRPALRGHGIGKPIKVHLASRNERAFHPRAYNPPNCVSTRRDWNRNNAHAAPLNTRARDPQ